MVFALVVGWWATSQAGTTGKIAGKVTDTVSKEPLVGVTVLVEGTKLGAATDINGQYAIINIPPGKYNLSASSLGYQKVRVDGVQVSVDQTTRISFELTETSVVGEEVVIIARRPLLQKDLTSSSSKVTAEQTRYSLWRM